VLRRARDTRAIHGQTIFALECQPFTASRGFIP
jgi:hypothetical protein